MNLILFDDPAFRDRLKPLVLNRPVAGLRCGIYTLQEKWENGVGGSASFLTEGYLSQKYPSVFSLDNLYINAHLLPNEQILAEILALKDGEALRSKTGILLAARTSKIFEFGFAFEGGIAFEGEFDFIQSLPDLFLKNGAQIKEDYKFFQKNRDSQPITDPHTVTYGEVFVGKDVSIRAAILSAVDGPIILDEGAIIQEGAIIIGPTYIGKNSMVAFGAKIRSNTSLGPNCRVGGEVGNSIFQAYSNKAHDGFLGNSYIGAWCNLGANTNNSNLKNNYKEVLLHSYQSGKLEPSGQIFCGTFMGDYTKAGISTMFNTGTVVGISSNVFGAGFQSKYIPSFTWGGEAEGYTKYKLDKAIEVIQATMARKEETLDKEEERILAYLAEKGL